MSGVDTLSREQLNYFQQVLQKNNGNVGRQVRTVVKGQMQSDVTNANSNRIHDSSRKG